METGTTANKKKGGTRGLRWRSLEDECLIEAWKAAILDPITGADLTSSKYYGRIFDQFSERKQFGDFSSIHMIRNESAMSHRLGDHQGGMQQIS
jgi:hypothetical protein